MAESSQSENNSDKNQEKVRIIEVQSADLFIKEIVCETGKECRIIVKPEQFYFSL